MIFMLDFIISFTFKPLINPNGEEAMKTIYLVRHGETVSTGNRCIGHTDLSLSDTGYREAERLREWFSEIKLAAIFSSPLERCRETARILGGGQLEIGILPELTEMDAGDWENLSFDDIRRLYPKEYEERGRHLGTVAPPKGESVMEAGARFGACVERLARKTEGDFAVVCHSGAARGFLCPLMNINPDEVFSIRQPFGAISKLEWNGEKFAVLSVGVKPDSFPDENEQKSFMQKCGTSERIIAHCEAVAYLACDWAESLEKKGIPVKKELLRAACRLHDIAHSAQNANHAELCAKMLSDGGYPELAELILQHNDLSPDAPIEAKLLFLADKRFKETEKVTLSQRFESSKAKCTTPEAILAWQKRYDCALKVESELKRMLS